jgi:indolepyruvate ferredoxin oxidoreductase beta subunit
VGALVIVSADDPGMSSSQNEQDNRRYAVAAGVPMLEPADSQEAYDFTLRAAIACLPPVRSNLTNRRSNRRRALPSPNKAPNKVVNVVIAGLGGQGALKASDIVAAAAFRCGLDVKKSEIHGMSQRGGSVTSDIRFGAEVFSPMVPPGEADFLVVLAPSQVENNRWQLRPGGTLIPPDLIDENTLRSKKSLNVALLGALSALLDLPEEQWLAAIRGNLPEKLHDMNLNAFHKGREAAARLPR